MNFIKIEKIATDNDLIAEREQRGYTLTDNRTCCTDVCKNLKELEGALFEWLIANQTKAYWRKLWSM